jgi:DNA invertase Pin-like site-specific DNA recombinase
MSHTGYARASTEDQDEAAQLDALRLAGCDVLYTDHASGKDMDRPQWKACLRSLGVGDTLVVTRIDRMGRSLVDLVETLDVLGARGVQFRSLTEGIDTTTPGGRMVFQVCGAFAEYERALIRSRTREGMAAARARGARIGRPPALTIEQVVTARRLHASGESVSSIARVLGVSRSTIQRAIRCS